MNINPHTNTSAGNDLFEAMVTLYYQCWDYHRRYLVSGGEDEMALIRWKDHSKALDCMIEICQSQQWDHGEFFTAKEHAQKLYDMGK